MQHDMETEVLRELYYGDLNVKMLPTWALKFPNVTYVGPFGALAGGLGSGKARRHQIWECGKKRAGILWLGP